MAAIHGSSIQGLQIGTGVSEVILDHSREKQGVAIQCSHGIEEHGFDEGIDVEFRRLQPESTRWTRLIDLHTRHSRLLSTRLLISELLCTHRLSQYRSKRLDARTLAENMRG